jgi:hypothetical protein
VPGIFTVTIYVFKYETVSEQLSGFSWNVILGSLTKICEHIQILIKMEPKIMDNLCEDSCVFMYILLNI